MVRLTNDDAAILLRLLRDTGARDSPLSRNIALQMDREGDEDGNLVDLIADVVMGPMARNVLSGPALEELRESLLTTRELNTLRGVIAQEMACAGCGRPLIQGGEIVSFQKPHMVYCSACALPNRISCWSCKGSINLPGTLTKMIQKIVKDCPHCMALKTMEKKPFDPAADGQPQVGGDPTMLDRGTLDGNIGGRTTVTYNPVPAGTAGTAAPATQAQQAGMDWITFNEVQEQLRQATRTRAPRVRLDGGRRAGRAVPPPPTPTGQWHTFGFDTPPPTGVPFDIETPTRETEDPIDDED